MKNKTKALVLMLSILFLATWFFLLSSNPEPHFKVMKDGNVISNAEYSKEIGQDLSKSWLDQNCKVQNQNEAIYQCDTCTVQVWNQMK
jgi:hypothetical protein